MKTILTAAFVIFFALHAFAQIQISNTKWKGQISSQGEVILDFKSDTVYIYRNGNELISTLTYNKNQDTISVFKAVGTGPCPVNGKGIYRIEMVENGGKFYFHLISEECPGRGIGLTSSVFERIH